MGLLGGDRLSLLPNPNIVWALFLDWEMEREEAEGCVASIAVGTAEVEVFCFLLMWAGEEGSERALLVERGVWVEGGVVSVCGCGSSSGRVV